MAQFEFLSSNGLNYYHNLLSTYIDEADALSIKYITFTPAGNTGVNPATISFWKVDPASSGAQPYQVVTLPDFDDFVQKVGSGHTGEIAIIDSTGNITYSSLLASDIIRKSSDSGATFTEGQVATFDSNGNAVKGTTLADVATSGDAADVSFTPGTTGLASTDVQGALEELAAASGGGVASKTVYITETAGGASDLYSKRYGIYQGATGSSVSPVPAEKLTDIDIPKDMVVESGTVETVTTADDPYPGAQVGDKYIDLILANATSSHVYIPVKDLVDVYTGGTTADGTIAISSSNKITFTLSQSVHGSLALADNSLQKSSGLTPTANNLIAFNATGEAIDSGLAISAINTDTFAPIANATIDAIVAGTYTPTT